MKRLPENHSGEMISLTAMRVLLLPLALLVGCRAAPCRDRAAENCAWQPASPNTTTAAGSDPGLFSADNVACRYSCSGLEHYYAEILQKTPANTARCCIAPDAECWPPAGTNITANGGIVIMQGHSAAGPRATTALAARIHSLSNAGTAIILRHVTMAGIQAPKDSVGNYGDGGAVQILNGYQVGPRARSRGPVTER